MDIPYRLDPIRALANAALGPEHAMVEWLILHSFHHGSSRLEFRTIEGEFRVAQIIDGQAYEYPRPADSIRQPTIDHLRTVFCLSGGAVEAEQILSAGESTAKARCRISEDNFNAVVSMAGQFTPSVELLPMMQRFFRICAAKRGKLAFVKHIIKSIVWDLEDRANQAVNRSRR